MGEPVSVAVSTPNPWMLVGQLGLLLMVVFVADTAWTVWRRGDRRQAVVVGAGTLFFTVAGSIQSILVVWGMVPGPIFATLFYTGIVAAMALELSQDVLRAARLSDQLLQSDQRMTQTAEAANLGIWIRDLERNEVWATDKWRDLLGFTPSEPLSLEGFFRRLHPDDREPLRKALTESVENAESYEREYRVMLPGGDIRWIGSRGRVETNRAGRAARVRGISIDITARKKAELECWKGARSSRIFPVWPCSANSRARWRMS